MNQRFLSAFADSLVILEYFRRQYELSVRYDALNSSSYQHRLRLAESEVRRLERQRFVPSDN